VSVFVGEGDILDLPPDDTRPSSIPRADLPGVLEGGDVYRAPDSVDPISRNRGQAPVGGASTGQGTMDRLLAVIGAAGAAAAAVAPLFKRPANQSTTILTGSPTAPASSGLLGFLPALANPFLPRGVNTTGGTTAATPIGGGSSLVPIAVVGVAIIGVIWLGRR